MGLKCTQSKPAGNSQRIKIRPLWDWNKELLQKAIDCIAIKIRPLWDWN